MSAGLSRFAAAMVIARRDFVAILFKKSFILFLLSPFFPVVVSAIAGGIGKEVRDAADRPELGIAMEAADNRSMTAAWRDMAPRLANNPPDLKVVAELAPGQEFDAASALANRRGNFAAIVTGTPAAPVLTGPMGRIEQWQGPVSLVAARAAGGSEAAYPHVLLAQTVSSKADERRGQTLTAQVGQTVLFLLMMLLAGMVLSNLVEEKGNKIIEILAAAVPMDAVFLGKLFAMLAVSMVGIAVWAMAGGALVLLAGSAMPAIPPPAVGWPLFFALGVAYFAMGYLLIGSVFLTVGAFAPTVRDVQSLSMPASMIQLLLFLFASYALARPGGWAELAAIATPFSSPFAMIARAAQDPAMWPHAAALAWQALWVVLFVHFGARLFRTWAMKSGPASSGGGWLRRRKTAAA